MSRPSRQRNADLVNSADARDLRLDLNLGYPARLSQNATNPACKCRNVCCNGTDDTSFKNANSCVRFHSVSHAEDCTYVVRWRSTVHARVRASSARLYTFRTHPKVRPSSSACSGDG
ncbi:hypothetical protein AB0C02_20495 [Micromonospora sp. NPDC048999]|uniref:hypothetical protein n=1 Tax=Micromonospora sp. NPDC048999 TaxID=3155391 RepID=UPI0033EDECCF